MYHSVSMVIFQQCIVRGIKDGMQKLLDIDNGSMPQLTLLGWDTQNISSILLTFVYYAAHQNNNYGCLKCGGKIS